LAFGKCLLYFLLNFCHLFQLMLCLSWSKISIFFNFFDILSFLHFLFKSFHQLFKISYFPYFSRRHFSFFSFNSYLLLFARFYLFFAVFLPFRRMCRRSSFVLHSSFTINKLIILIVRNSYVLVAKKFPVDIPSENYFQIVFLAALVLDYFRFRLIIQEKEHLHSAEK